MAAWLSLASVLAVLVAVTTAHKNFTVTEEVWFDVEIKDNDGICFTDVFYQFSINLIE
jgi:glycine cleavage system regulatory protein